MKKYVIMGIVATTLVVTAIGGVVVYNHMNTGTLSSNDISNTDSATNKVKPKTKLQKLYMQININDMSIEEIEALVEKSGLYTNKNGDSLTIANSAVEALEGKGSEFMELNYYDTINIDTKARSSGISSMSYILMGEKEICSMAQFKTNRTNTIYKQKDRPLYTVLTPNTTTEVLRICKENGLYDEFNGVGKEVSSTNEQLAMVQHYFGNLK